MNYIKVNIEDLPEHNTPILNYCRKLVKKGELEDSILEVFRNGKSFMKINGIGKGAKLTVREEPKCTFSAYSPFPEELQPSTTNKQAH